MKFAVSLAVLALAVAVFAADPAPPAAFTCTGKDVTGKTHYKDPLSGKGWSGNYACMKYHECTGGKDNVHECFWFIPLRQYDPKTRGCAFFWHAKCSDPDPK